MLTQAEIDALISCSKVVTTAMKREHKDEHKHLRNGFELASEIGEHRFVCFTRILKRFPENFSIGLDYLSPTGGRLTLLRCNGDHGIHQNFVRDGNSFSGYHVHLATEEAMSEDCSVENFAVQTSAYASFEEALYHFLGLVNVKERIRHFPTICGQMSLLEKAGVNTDELLGDP